ncbi:MAG TPA: RodZ domain-containing protein [Acetobacteraceae bacterium]|nr:RodZ domain-containing protein [Acetobacteraceae bacterium]
MMSSATPDIDAAAGAGSRVGADLRAARERLGWDLQSVATGLRIKRRFLDAIECGRLADLPGNAYAVGFVRTYASALGLDPDEAIRRFRAEGAEVNRKTELAFPAPVPERGVPAGAVVLLGVVIAIVAYVGWYRASGREHLPARPEAPVPAQLAPLAAPSAQITPPAAPAPSKLATAGSSALAPPATSGAGTTAPAVAPGSTATPAPGNELAASVPGTGIPAAANSPAAATTAATAGAAGANRLALLAIADSWVQVRDETGQVLMSRILHAGDTWAVPDQPNLTFTTGNAGGTELIVDGVSSAPLGSPGAVLRNVPLNAATAQPGANLQGGQPASPPQGGAGGGAGSGASLVAPAQAAQ